MDDIFGIDNAYRTERPIIHLRDGGICMASALEHHDDDPGIWAPGGVWERVQDADGRFKFRYNIHRIYFSPADVASVEGPHELLQR